MSERRNWRDFGGIVHRLARGRLRAACGESQASQRSWFEGNLLFRAWQPTRAPITCVGCLGEVDDA